MKEIFIIHAHWNNRGDEAANRALIDELLEGNNDIHISLQINSNVLYEVETLEKQGINVLHNRFPKMKNMPEVILMLLSGGRIALTKNGKEFIKNLRNADIVVHSPGGPSIGDIYRNAEIPYLMRLLLVKRMKKRYFFYAPSMGPFRSPLRNPIRKRLLKGASGVTLRESISKNYVREFAPDVKCEVTLDSAFQHKVDIDKNAEILEKYTELSQFLAKYDKIVGITITDLQWNPLYLGDEKIKENISITFKDFIQYLKKDNYGVVFIPQLFGSANDKKYMTGFAEDNCFVVNDTYDCYFQQFLISKLYAVVGMRYHSNIFSCKMKVPFISVSYEQKMKGFMESQELTEYCIDIKDLSYKELVKRFELLTESYDDYANKFNIKSEILEKQSRRTTDILLDLLERDRRNL